MMALIIMIYIELKLNPVHSKGSQDAIKQFQIQIRKKKSSVINFYIRALQLIHICF